MISEQRKAGQTLEGKQKHAEVAFGRSVPFAGVGFDALCGDATRTSEVLNDDQRKGGPVSRSESG